jgi:flagellar biosynthesis component FlhA
LPAVRERLHGNEGAHVLFEVGTELQMLIESSLLRSDATPTLAMDPSSCQEALTAVRNEISDHGPAALVVDPPTVRPFVRLLVELEFPDLAVLSRAELAGGRTPSRQLELPGDDR